MEAWQTGRDLDDWRNVGIHFLLNKFPLGLNVYFLRFPRWKVIKCTKI